MGLGTRRVRGPVPVRSSWVVGRGEDRAAAPSSRRPWPCVECRAGARDGAGGPISSITGGRCFIVPRLSRVRCFYRCYPPLASRPAPSAARDEYMRSASLQRPRLRAYATHHVSISSLKYSYTSCLLPFRRVTAHAESSSSITHTQAYLLLLLHAPSCACMLHAPPLARPPEAQTPARCYLHSGARAWARGSACS